MVDDDDDSVRLDPAYLLQSAGEYAEFVGDQLQFTGFDLGSARRSRGQDILDDGASVADYEDQWEIERQRYASHLRAMKERDKALVKSANDKMRRAREKGRSRASLSPDEIEALERRRLLEKQESPRSSATKDRRSSSGKNSRSTSASNLAVDKTRRKSGSRFFSSPAANSSRTRIPKTSPKQSRHASLDNTHDPRGAPGFVVPGPDGQPMYSPLPYYPPSSYSRSDARTASTSSVRHIPQDYQGGYVPYSPRYFTPQDYKPTSSTTSRRSPPDELHLPRTRERASSSVPYPSDPHLRAGSSSHARRNVSGPAGTSYDRHRRTPTSPLAEYPVRGDSLGKRAEDFEVHDEDEGSSDGVVVVNDEGESEGSDSDEEGVKVEVGLDGRDGYKIERVPVGGRREKDRERDRDREKDRRRKRR
ncbi:hypothetical protein KVT40_008372 [Elsinoe batatas]|uniref:Uncharacterized protein n=1 Tax=Elsinoe batatas TaxID=2601811 RepID=A0A8K0KT27_9PEZI|nr:hypothetical protein KVT40_008372 [Elsinoe batatas]